MRVQLGYGLPKKINEIYLDVLTGEASTELASFHIIEMDNAIDVACSSKLSIPGIGQRVHQLLAHCQVFLVLAECPCSISLFEDG